MNSEAKAVGTPRGAAKLGILAVIALLAGCGGSSSGNNLGPAGKFVGHWSLDTLNTTFSITCTMGSGAVSLNFWPELDFEHGVLTDVSESSSTCVAPGLAFDVDKSGSSLSLPNPDPYTGNPPFCAIPIATDANGLTVYLQLTPSAFTFTLLAPVKDKAPTGLLSINSPGGIFRDDGTGTGNLVQSDSCMYTGTNDTYHRMSQP